MNSVQTSYSLPILHILLAHLNQDSIKFMVRNELITHGRNSIFDPSGHIDCEACRTFKSQSLEKGKSHPHLSRRFTPETLSGSLSNIPEDILMTDTFIPVSALDLVHSDGFQFDFFSGRQLYFFIFIDHVTDFRMIYSATSKADFLSSLQAFHAFSFFYHKTNIKGLRMDNAGEMSSSEVYEFARFHGIHLQRCAAYDHHQNGVAERAVRTAEEAALTMLHHAGLSVPKFLLYALINSTQIRNKCVTSKSRGKVSTPHELFTGVKPKVEDLHPTGQVCYSYIKKDQRKRKYDPKAKKCIFLCEDFERKAYVLMDVYTRSIVISRDVRFPSVGATLLFPAPVSPISTHSDSENLDLRSDERSDQTPSFTTVRGYNQLVQPPASETTMDNASQIQRGQDLNQSISELAGLLARNSITESSTASAPLTPILGVATEEEISVPSLTSEPLLDTTNNTGSNVDLCPLPDSEAGVTPEAPPSVPSSTNVPVCSSSEGVTPISYVRKKNPKYYSQEFVNTVISAFPDVPTSYKKAMLSPEKKFWSDACRSELDSLHREGTWQLVPRTKDLFIVKSKWVFKLKYNELGEVARWALLKSTVSTTQRRTLLFCSPRHVD